MNKKEIIETLMSIQEQVIALEYDNGATESIADLIAAIEADSQVNAEVVKDTAPVAQPDSAPAF